MIKKSLIISLASLLVISTVFVACSKGTNEKETTTGGLATEDSYGTETEVVTDENGKAVTDKNGNEVTTDVNVKYTTDKDGNEIAVVIDNNGEQVTDKKGNAVTLKITTTKSTSKLTTSKSKNTTKTTVKANTTNKNQTTNNSANSTTDVSEWTTIDNSKDVVPKTSASGKTVAFSKSDMEIIDSMLGVPYAYNCSYENADLENISSSAFKEKFTAYATHAAVYMSTIDSQSGNLPSGTVVLNLFKYYGQTVSNFKSNCNSAVKADSNTAPIKYNSKNDTFDITGAESSTHTVTITNVQYLGNNNYYKVTGTVSGAKGVSKVVAVVQKNKLHANLGFSIKAVKWS